MVAPTHLFVLVNNTKMTGWTCRCSCSAESMSHRTHSPLGCHIMKSKANRTHTLGTWLMAVGTGSSSYVSVSCIRLARNCVVFLPASVPTPSSSGVLRACLRLRVNMGASTVECIALDKNFVTSSSSAQIGEKVVDIAPK